MYVFVSKYNTSVYLANNSVFNHSTLSDASYIFTILGHVLPDSYIWPIALRFGVSYRSKTGLGLQLFLHKYKICWVTRQTCHPLTLLHNSNRSVSPILSISINHIALAATASAMA